MTAPTASNTIQFQVNAATASFYLSFPLSGYTPYNAPITSVFDHSGGRYAADQKVVAYTGEVGNVPDGTKPVVVVVNGVSVSLYSYKKADGRPFLVNKVNYIGTGTIGASSLNYDGHPGYDYPVPLGTEVYAAADGAVETANTNASDPAGIYIRVQHDSAGYQTQYLHLSQILVSQGTTVTRGQLIGYSGNTGPASTGPHLHFEVKKNVTSVQGSWTSVDPYEWTGSGADPYAIVNVNLWQVPTSQTPAPTITSINSSNPVTGQDTRQTITINGTNFVNGSTVYLTWTGGSKLLPLDQVTFDNNTQLRMSITTMAEADTWTAMVINPDGKQSNTQSFLVVTSQSPAETVLLGVDVSHYQNERGAIDWNQVRTSGRIFAFTKATGGDLAKYDDPYFTQNMANGKTAGLIMGAYHVAYPPLADAVAEANHFVAVAGPYITAGYLHPVLDIEPMACGIGKTAISQWIRDWCNTVETQTGVRPILYMVRYDANNNMDADLNQYPIWVATNSTDPKASPGSLGAWTSWSFQQYGTDATQSTCPGITGYVDLDSFNGDLSTFNSNFVIQATNTLPKGDVNGDGEVNLADAILALKVITGMNPTSIMTNYPTSGADVSGYGKIGMSEVIYILQTVAGMR